MDNNLVSFKHFAGRKIIGLLRAPIRTLIHFNILKSTFSKAIDLSAGLLKDLRGDITVFLHQDKP